jgi:aldehyde:ferredoxin oxidoreductase
MFATYGQYADIDLSSGKICSYQIPENWYIRHVGGRGIAARILLAETAPKTTPLSEDNILVFATGPFQGLNLAGSARFLIMAKSPKTKVINESYCGGQFGNYLGRTGFDGIIIRGKSKNPVYISIDDENITINPGKDVWGLDPQQVENVIMERHGNVSIACIGKAGENQVLMSCIMVDRTHAAGRAGLGAVMGSKKLKAVVVRGSKEKDLADKERFKSLRNNFARYVVEPGKALHDHGTAAAVSDFNDMGILPTKNFAAGTFIGYKDIGSEALIKSKYLVKKKSCPGCPIACRPITEGLYNGRRFEQDWGGPEYETLAALGSLCLNRNLASICWMNQKCNKYGLDTISVGVAIAYLMEATEKGLLRAEDEVKWADSECMDRIIDKIAERSGIGEWIATGVEYLASRVGDGSFLMEAKGQEVALHDPRGKSSMALYYAMSPRGGNHNEGIHDPAPGNKALGYQGENDRLGWKNRVQFAAEHLQLRSFFNSAILCSFVADISSQQFCSLASELYEAATGVSLTIRDMLKIGERNYALLRLSAEQEGYTRRDDRLPSRFHEPLPESGFCVPKNTLNESIDEYYEIYGYGIYGPTNEQLKKLDLEELAR